MIIKEKVKVAAKDARVKAGQQQELDVAFYLRRTFKDHPLVFILHDFRFTFNNETAQIDHLIVYPFGFVLLESKSIEGEVTVNAEGEWSRSVKSKWQGMPSPIKQVELQEKLLREMLYQNKHKILPKFMFNLVQQSFGGRKWDQLCVVSSSSIIDRDNIPKSISSKVVKSEFIADAVTKIMNLPRFDSKIIQTLKIDTRPDFSKEELNSICQFLLESDLSQNTIYSPQQHKSVETTSEKPAISCKQCSETELVAPKYGRYGYYVKCEKCGTNTSMKLSCSSCNSQNTKVNKKATQYKLVCLDCSSQKIIIEAR